MRSRRAVELRRDRHDADVGPRGGNLVEDLRAGEIPLGSAASQRPQALERLRALVLRVDEVALEVRGEHPRAAGRRARARLPDGCEHTAQRRGRARDRRRAERRDAEARQPRRDRPDRVVAVQRVGSLDAVHVDVDEAGHDVVLRQIEVDVTAAAGPGAGRESAMRSPSRRSVPGLSSRSGRTTSAPASTIMRARAAASALRRSRRRRRASGEISRRTWSTMPGGRRRANSWRTGSSSRSPAAATSPLRITTSGSRQLREVRDRHADVPSRCRARPRWTRRRRCARRRTRAPR